MREEQSEHFPVHTCEENFMMRCAVCAQHFVAALMVRQKSYACSELLKILSLSYAHGVVATQ